MKVVIIGGVAGGASAAARLRRLDEKAEILLLERGPYISFANCGLPYYVGGVITDRAALTLQTRRASVSCTLCFQSFSKIGKRSFEYFSKHRKIKDATSIKSDEERTFVSTYEKIPATTVDASSGPGGSISISMMHWRILSSTAASSNAGDVSNSRTGSIYLARSLSSYTNLCG